MAKPRILVVEDDPKTAASVRLYLEHGGYEVELAADGRAGLDAATREPPPDLVVLDRMLPELDGLAVFRALRGRAGPPVILLTARAAEADRLEGLELGADDYVTKPFSPRELVARVRNVLRRTRPPQDEVVEAGALRLDVGRREAAVAGEVVALTPREFALLLALARTPGRVFSRRELLERAFGGDSDALDRTVDAHVMNLRRKLEKQEAARGLVETVFGAGYRLVKRPA